MSLKVCQIPYSVGVHPTAIAQPYNIVRFPNAALQGGTVAPSSSSELTGIAVQ
ncbi:colicin release lysis protein [Escherichia coli]|nr:colicin release lysis protein [Escherichia coli]